MTKLLTLSPTTARRLAISRQGLAGEGPPADAEGIMQILDNIRCLQLDPIRAVERTQLLVLWSRLGNYEPALLDELLWQRRQLFEYWAHAASIVLLADYPFFRPQMREWGSGSSAWEKRTRRWVADNDSLRRSVLNELTDGGPLASDQLTDSTDRAWVSGGWSSGRNVNRMLDYLWGTGQIMVASRQGQKRLWDLSHRCLPEWTVTHELSWPETVFQTVQLSLRALGVARPEQIKRHFTRGSYPGLAKVLQQLERGGQIVPAKIVDDGQIWPGSWYIHRDDLAELRAIEQGDWQPRTTLLSPFDNLICDRQRTEELFNFFYRIEIYVPKAKRQYGYYVLPILHGDRLIGRLDPKMDRQSGKLHINSLFLEDGTPQDAATGRAVLAAIDELATFLGAKEIVYHRPLPAGWRPA